MFKTLGTLGALAFIITLLALVILGPWVVIWAWNTLFGPVYTIGYTFWTWLAVLIIGVFIRSDVKVTKKS
jgi:hypothetical protein